MKAIKTNWINLLGVFLVTLVYFTVSTLLDPNLSYNILQAILAALFGVLGFGMVAWIPFVIALIVFDLILNVKNQNSLKAKLFIEWIVISSPFIYCAVKYSEWVLIAAIITFFITQLLREKKIRQIDKLNY
jgi:hypothetical protein